MKRKHRLAAALLSTAAAAAAGTILYGTVALADVIPAGYRGDVNGDGTLSLSDIITLQRSMLNISPLTGDRIEEFADLNEDGRINGLDLTVLRQCVLGVRDWTYVLDYTAPVTTEPPVITTETPAVTTQETTRLVTTTTEASWTQDSVTTTKEDATTITTTTTTTTTAATTTPVIETTVPYDAPFVQPAIAEINASLPSQGTANLVIFYVDFPDCTYGSADMTADQVDQIAFGPENTKSAAYPFESMSAFYSRSSKGAMALTGKTFRYTAKENRSAYDTDKVKLAEECYDYFDSQGIDFSQYDGNGDGRIDATLFTVPTAAGDDNWWPCAGAFGDSYYTVDGKTIGHIITGNAQINSTADYTNFTSSYLHEMGHCMGLPDYYLYSSDDYEGMHGEAGMELMDTDAYSDFCSFSKLMLGWYKENQVAVYDKSAGTQTFELRNAQTDGGNCVIIPYGDLSSYTSTEYFIVEYATLDANNSGLASYWWWEQFDSGVRVHHVKPEIMDNGWWKFFKYENGSEYTDTNGDGTADDDGIRLIRLVNEGNECAFKTGDVIDNKVSGFGWYDSSENEAIDPGVTITVGALQGDTYTITISPK